MTAILSNADRLRELDAAIEAREAEDRAVHTGDGFDLRTLAVETMRRGYMGFTVLVKQSGPGLPFVGAFRDYRDNTVEATLSTYATPDAALSALLSQSMAR